MTANLSARPTPATGVRARSALAALLVAAALAFVVGVAIEKDSIQAEPVASAGTTPTGGVETGAEGGEAGSEGAGSGETGTETGAEHRAETAVTGHAETSSEGSVLGVPLESPAMLIGVLAASVLLALAVWRRPIPAVLLLAGGFAAVAAVFDVGEISRQVGEHRAGVVAVAAVVAALHVAAAALALVLWKATTTRQAITA